MQVIAKMLILTGVVFVLMGLLLLASGKIFPLIGHLPGDIELKRDNFTVYIPIASSLLISLLLTVVLNLILWLVNRN